MASGWKWKIDFDTSSIRKGGEEAERAIENAADVFDDYARAADRATDKVGDNLGDGVKNGAREGERALDRLEAAFQDAQREIGRKTRQIGEQSKENIALTPDDVFKADLKAELVSNMAESGAEVARGFKDGFDGEDVETIIDGLSDTIVSVGAMSGSALGAAGGLAAATGLNLIAAPLIADAEAKAALYEQVYNDAFTAIKENGAALGAQIAVQTQIAEISGDTDKMADAVRRANILGAETSLVIGAMAGSQGDLDDVTQLANAAIEDQNAKMRELAAQYQNGDITAAQWKSAQEGADQAVRDLNSAIGDITGEFSTHNSAVDAAAAGVDALNRATERTNNDLTEQAKALAASSGEAQDFAVNIDGATVKLRAMPDGKVVQVTDQGTADLTQRQIDGIDGKTVAINTSLDTSGADRAYAAWASRWRTVSVNTVLVTKAV